MKNKVFMEKWNKLNAKDQAEFMEWMLEVLDTLYQGIKPTLEGLITFTKEYDKFLKMVESDLER